MTQKIRKTGGYRDVVRVEDVGKLSGLPDFPSLRGYVWVDSVLPEEPVNVFMALRGELRFLGLSVEDLLFSLRLTSSSFVSLIQTRASLYPDSEISFTGTLFYETHQELTFVSWKKGELRVSTHEESPGKAKVLDEALSLLAPNVHTLYVRSFGLEKEPRVEGEDVVVRTRMTGFPLFRTAPFTSLETLLLDTPPTFPSLGPYAWRLQAIRFIPRPSWSGVQAREVIRYFEELRGTEKRGPFTQVHTLDFLIPLSLLPKAAALFPNATPLHVVPRDGDDWYPIFPLPTSSDSHEYPTQFLNLTMYKNRTFVLYQ